MKNWIIGLGASIAAIMAIWLKGRSDGKSSAIIAAKSEDLNNATKISEAVDSAKSTNITDPVSVLDKANRLRD